MKPYILNNKTLVVADIWPALMVIAIFAISYNLLLEYESTKTIVYYAICIAVFFYLECGSGHQAFEKIYKKQRSSILTH